MVVTIEPSGRTSIGPNDAIQAVLADVRREAKEAAKLASLRAAEAALPKLEPRYLGPRRTFGAASASELQQSVDLARTRKQDRIYTEHVRMAETSVEHHRAVLGRREALSENTRQLQQQHVERKACLAQQASERLEQEMWANNKDRTAKEKEKARHILDLKRAIERKSCETLAAGYARQEQVELNQLQRWEDWHNAKTDAWATGLSAEETNSILNAPWRALADTTHGSCTAAIENAHRTMERNNHLLASTIGRRVGKAHVRPFSPLMVPSTKRQSTSAAEGFGRRRGSGDGLTPCHSSPSTKASLSSSASSFGIKTMKPVRTNNDFGRREPSVANHRGLAQRQAAQEARLAAQRLERAEVLETRAKGRAERLAQARERAARLADDRMSVVIENAAQRDERGKKSLQQVQQLLQEKVRAAIEQRETRFEDTVMKQEALAHLRMLSQVAAEGVESRRRGEVRAKLDAQAAAKAEERHRRSSMMHPSACARLVDQLGTQAAPNDHAAERRARRAAREEKAASSGRGLGHRGEKASSVRPCKATSTLSPRTTKVLKGLGLKPGFWSMLESAVVDLLPPPELDVGQAGQFSPQEQRMRQTWSSPTLPSVEQAFLTEAASSNAWMAGERKSPSSRHMDMELSSSSSQDQSAQEECQWSPSSRERSNLTEVGVDQTVDDECPSDDDEESFTQEELLREFDHQLGSYFENMRKEWAAAEDAGVERPRRF